MVTFTSTTMCVPLEIGLGALSCPYFRFVSISPIYTTPPPQIFTLREFFYGLSRPRIAALDSS